MSREADLIRRIAAQAGAARDDVAVDLGDDAAVVRVPAGHELVLCVDTLVAGVHFPEGTDAGSVGHKALAVNLSDLAAMGAEPAWALVALTLPEPDADWVDAFAAGLGALAASHGVRVIGGDTTRGPLSVTVQAAGLVPTGAALTRGTARVGDGLFVTGTLGDAALALSLMQRGDEPPAELRTRLDRPTPRVAEGLALRGTASAAIDVSDGLLKDLDRLLGRTGLGATVEVDALPRSDAFAAAGGNPRHQLAGGDDYELLFASARDDAPGTRIGRVEATPGVVCIDAHGRPLAVETRGYDAFA